MAINRYLSTIESKKHKQSEQKLTDRYRECFDTCQMGGRLGRRVEKVRGLRGTKWLLQNSHGDVQYSLGTEPVIF